MMELLAHSGSISAKEDRSSVLYRGRALSSDLLNTPHMENGFDIDAMRGRLSQSLDEKGLSMRKVSIDSGNGPGYVHSILNEGKIPKVTSLDSVCRAAGISLTYVMFGHEITPQVEALMSRVQGRPDKLASLLALLGDDDHRSREAS